MLCKKNLSCVLMLNMTSHFLKVIEGVISKSGAWLFHEIKKIVPQKELKDRLVRENAINDDAILSHMDLLTNDPNSFKLLKGRYN